MEEGASSSAPIPTSATTRRPRLKSEFDAIILGVGALHGRDLPVPGRELDGIHLAMDYLVQQNRRVAGLPVEEEEITAKGKNVVILGGGDTSADCLGNAHREGCASVKVLTHGPKPPDHPGTMGGPTGPSSSAPTRPTKRAASAASPSP